MRLYNEAELKKDPKANFGREYQQCTKSVMDTIADPNIKFDEKGICNYYYEYLLTEKEQVYYGKSGEMKLEEVVSKIKAAGKSKKYDCITGVSGGVDSTYLTYTAKKLGLNPLVVHFDNGWNSEIAVKNIENIISKLGLDLKTLVVDWEEFKDLQLSYLKASVVDIEALTDHAITGSLYRLAAQNNIKYILSGTNVVTEAVLPKYWITNKTDHVNIQSIHKKFGKVKLKTYPFFGEKEKRYYSSIKGIESINLLNYLPYNKAKVKETIIKELGWKDYGGKHYESVFTRFYQGYILPVKFHIDKRKAHFSNLIFSNQISKDEALKELQKPIYDPGQLHSDYEFVIKKFNITKEAFEDLLSTDRKEHEDYGIDKGLYEKYSFLKPLRPAVNYFKKFRTAKD
ncbi:MAG: N-acetyl sugar amidotransferase [Chitinophagaceae bacterium]